MRPKADFRAVAVAAYTAYARRITQHTGAPMPLWQDLTRARQDAWVEAVRAAVVAYQAPPERDRG